jgi:hypothetical protein
MTHRQPALKAQAAMLRQALSERGHVLRQGETLELVAKLNGFPSWNVAKKQAASPTKAHPSELPEKLEYKVWVAVHYHRHGHDSFYFPHLPSEEEVIEHVKAVSSWEPEAGETVEVLGVETFIIDLPEELRKQASRQLSSPLISVYEVCMLDLFEYETPESVAEWQWVESMAAFKHVGNGTQGGVWEFMVHADKLRNHLSEVPASLRAEVDRALAHQATWVMFHQG